MSLPALSSNLWLYLTNLPFPYGFSKENCASNSHLSCVLHTLPNLFLISDSLIGDIWWSTKLWSSLLCQLLTEVWFLKITVFKKRVRQGIFHFGFNWPSISDSLFMFANKKNVKADINYLNHEVIVTCIF